MNEWLSNPQWWISTTVAALIGITLPQFFNKGRIVGTLIMSRAKGKLLSHLRHQKYKHLKKVKRIRFDGTAINREIALSYALFVCFVTTTIAAIAVMFSLSAAVRESKLLTVITGLTAATPALIFELAWLLASSRVDELLKYRRLIKPRNRRLH
jgi:hypothetical protein